MRIGIDVGGTFTDIVLIDDQRKKIHYTKTLTIPKNPAQGVLNGIEKMLRMANATMADLDYMVHGHGTTIGTNALIERKGAMTGLVTTAGFRDVLEIARIERPDEGLYDLTVDTPEPLVPRYLRAEVTERVGAHGEIVCPLDEASVVQAAKYLKAQGVSTIAVCLLFSFLNPKHEQRVKEICREIYPEAFVSISSEICPEFREFERTSTTVINAYLQPIVERYIRNLTAMLNEKYGTVEVRIMQASGGAMSAETARDHAVNIVNSGPAGGAVAGAFIGKLLGDKQLMTVDMGGTSFDIGLIIDGVPRVSSEGKFEGYPVKIPAVDVHAIGAGGGSIAWIDKGGALNMGPQSAAADPGPACYGLGGELPVVTDANLVLGRLNPDYFLGGEMKLYPDKARAAIEKYIARPLKMSVEDAAYGMIRVVNANMVKGMAGSSIEKGFDPREFTLVAFGGAGPLHACELAKEIGMRKVVIPLYPGALSAFGLVTSDIRHDYVQTIAKPAALVDAGELAQAYAAMEAKAHAQLREEKIAESEIEVEWTADLRYAGQAYELNVPVTRNRKLSRKDVDATVARFHALHQKVYEYSSATEPIDVINVRLVAKGRVPDVKLPKRKRGDASPRAALKGKRPVYFAGRGYVNVSVYERDLLQPGNLVKGPCMIEEIISSTVVIPGATAKVDVWGNVIIAL
ncbi:MAG: hydantoinase/oxoprolinase family protein [Chloroflexi bacterium]|nr:hydantoinase/oxoprolinase family protein [Chloroflexota bacterium]